MNASQKGKRFEREIATVIANTFNIGCKRTPQSGGMDFKGDIISLSGTPSHFHWECKHQEKLNIWNALKQAERDCQVDKTPVVVFRRNHGKAYACIEFNKFLDLLCCWKM